MQIDHVGIVVKSIEQGVELWKSVFGYSQKTEPVTNTKQKVRVVFLAKDNSIDIKLVEPTDESSPVSAFANKGGGLHHLCFKCSDVEESVKRFKEFGMRITAQPQPGEAFENENIAFVFVKGLNIELIDTEKRAGLVSRNLGARIR